MIPPKYKFYIGLHVKHGMYTYKNNTALNTTTGEEEASSAFCITSSIVVNQAPIFLDLPCKVGVQHMAYVFCYNDSGSYIGVINADKKSVVCLPDNTYYIRLMVSNADSEDAYKNIISGVDFIYSFTGVNPHYKELSKKYAKESGQEFFRISLDGKINLFGKDYEIIRNSSLEDNILFAITKYNKNSNNWIEYYKGECNKTDCKFDDEKKSCELKTTAIDEYNDVVNKYENTYDIIKWLIDNGADCKTGAPIYHACKSNLSFDIIKLLVENHADVNSYLPYDSSALTVLCSASPINIDIIRYLLENGADPNLQHQNHLPLIALIENPNRSLELIKMLVEHGADINQIVGSQTTARGSAFSFLFNDLLAQQLPDKEIIKYLLNKGADPNIPYVCEENRIYPIYFICKTNPIDTDLLELLLKCNADPNVTTSSKNYFLTEIPIFTLAKNPSAKANHFRLLLEHGADPNDVIPSRDINTTPLSVILSKSSPDPDIVQVLLEFGAQRTETSSTRNLPQPIQDLLKKYENN